MDSSEEQFAHSFGELIVTPHFCWPYFVVQKHPKKRPFGAAGLVASPGLLQDSHLVRKPRTKSVNELSC